jgi:hypothetical protein
MNKKTLLPAFAAFMILVMLAVAFPSAAAQVTSRDSYNMPLTIVTVAEDDQARQTGVMILCVTHGLTFGTGSDTRALDPNTCLQETVQTGPSNTISGGPTWNPWISKWTDYKILILLPNGAKFFWPVSQAFPTGLVLACEVIEKDTVEPKVPQASWEILKKMVTDRSSDFVCKFRWKALGGFYWSVGVLDLYYTGPQRSEDVAPYILDIQAVFTDPTTKLVYYGAEMQDLCMLAWPFNDPSDMQKRPFNLQKPEGLDLVRVPDPLDGFAGCQSATDFQRTLLGSYIPTAPQN